MNLSSNFHFMPLEVLLGLSMLLFNYSCIDLKSDQTQQRRNLEPFTGIKVGGAFEVVLTQNGRHQVLVEAEEDIINKVQTKVKGDVLHIDMDWNWPWSWNHDEITVYVEFDQLHSIVSSGASNVKAETPINAEDMDLKVSGAGDLDLEVHAESMEVTISGAGDVHLSGDTKTQKVRISGAGNYNAQHFKSRYTDAKISGAGNAVVYASHEFDADASGAGSIDYYGEPQQKQINYSGAGSINSR